jgi:hypothetical protein
MCSPWPHEPLIAGTTWQSAREQIIAKRISLGLAAVVNPMAADLAEFARIVPEKVEAFSAAGIAMFEQSKLVRNQITRFASDEVMTSARATIEMGLAPLL